ncbi:MAG: hypothetical protein ACOY3Y_21400 [Acidobacteriota bacterium]
MDILQVLRPLEQLERKLAEFYQWLADLFEADSEVAFTFHRMFLEERTHVNLIEYQRRLARGNPGAFGDIEVDLAGVEKAIATIDALRDNGGPPSLERAVRVALELESGAALTHLRSAIRQSSPDMARLLDSLGKGDRQHQRALRQLAERRGLA